MPGQWCPLEMGQGKHLLPKATEKASFWDCQQEKSYWKWKPNSIKERSQSFPGSIQQENCEIGLKTEKLRPKGHTQGRSPEDRGFLLTTQIPRNYLATITVYLITLYYTKIKGALCFHPEEYKSNIHSIAIYWWPGTKDKRGSDVDSNLKTMS